MRSQEVRVGEHRVHPSPPHDFVNVQVLVHGDLGRNRAYVRETALASSSVVQAGCTLGPRFQTSSFTIACASEMPASRHTAHARTSPAEPFCPWTDSMWLK